MITAEIMMVLRKTVVVVVRITRTKIAEEERGGIGKNKKKK